MSLLALIQRLAEINGQRICVQSGDRQLSYAELNQQVQALAEQLSTLSAKRVASLLDNGPEWLILDLAIQQLGLVHVPIPGFFHPSQVAHALEAAGVDVLISDRELPAFGESHRPLGQRLFAWRLPVPSPPTLVEGTALITFTSGTTGRPKGVCLSLAHLNAVASSLGPISTQTGASTHVCLLPLGVLLEQVAGMHATLLAGGLVCLPSLTETGISGASGADGGAMLGCLQRYGAHSAILLPQMLEALCVALEQGHQRPDSLRFLAVGGARVAPEAMTRARQLGLPVYQGYGLTEAGSVLFLERPDAECAGSVGKLLPGRQIHIDEKSEIWIEQPGFLGYLGEAASEQTRWPTGDLGQLDADGYLHLHGRRSNVLITAFGRNVCPEWIESELIAQPKIAQAFVSGEAEAWLQAVLVATDSRCSDLELEQAVIEVNARLPDYARIGGIVRSNHPFTPINGLTTANGRLQRPALMQRFDAELDALWDCERQLSSAHRPTATPTLSARSAV